MRVSIGRRERIFEKIKRKTILFSQSLFGQNFDGPAFVYDITGAFMYFLMGMSVVMIFVKISSDFQDLVVNNLWFNGFLLFVLLFVLRRMIFGKRMKGRRYF